jgi:hypothetical protein
MQNYLESLGNRDRGRWTSEFENTKRSVNTTPYRTEEVRGSRWHEAQMQEQPAFATGSQLPPTSVETIPARNINFFSGSENVAISGGSFYLNVYPPNRPPDISDSVGSSPLTMATDSRGSSRETRTSTRKQQPALIVSNELLGDN